MSQVTVIPEPVIHWSDLLIVLDALRETPGGIVAGKAPASMFDQITLAIGK